MDAKLAFFAACVCVWASFADAAPAQQIKKAVGASIDDRQKRSPYWLDNNSADDYSDVYSYSKRSRPYYAGVFDKRKSAGELMEALKFFLESNGPAAANNQGFKQLRFGVSRK